jgi:hypothetical protein
MEKIRSMVVEVACSMMDSDSFTMDTPLMEAGLDSLSSVNMRNELQK